MLLDRALMKYHVLNLGCKVNRVESDSYEHTLFSSGSDLSSLEEADVVIVNTCTVTGEAEKKTRKAVRSALRKNQHAAVLVTGCAVAIDPETFAAMSPRVQVVPKADVLGHLEALAHSVDGRSEDPPRFGRARMGVKIQDGCDNACTFCIVHVARGRAMSVPAEKVIDECVKLAYAGLREIVLTGINLGTYRDNKMDLASLLERMMEATDRIMDTSGRPCRFRISSIEPMDVSSALIDVLASSEGRVCRHLHLPLQSGSSKVLHEMARPYDADAFRGIVQDIKDRVPRISITTDVIAGFPGETECEFEETMAMCRESGFSKMHVFPYSIRKGTPAASREGQIGASVKTTRAARLRALSDELRCADFLSRCGVSELAVVEMSGRACTESYHEISVDPSIEAGSLVEVMLSPDVRIGERED